MEDLYKDLYDLAEDEDNLSKRKEIMTVVIPIVSNSNDKSTEVLYFKKIILRDFLKNDSFGLDDSFDHNFVETKKTNWNPAIKDFNPKKGNIVITILPGEIHNLGFDRCGGSPNEPGDGDSETKIVYRLVK